MLRWGAGSGDSVWGTLRRGMRPANDARRAEDRRACCTGKGRKGSEENGGRGEGGCVCVRYTWCSGCTGLGRGMGWGKGYEKGRGGLVAHRPRRRAGSDRPGGACGAGPGSSAVGPRLGSIRRVGPARPARCAQPPTHSPGRPALCREGALPPPPNPKPPPPRRARGWGALLALCGRRPGRTGTRAGPTRGHGGALSNRTE